MADRTRHRWPLLGGALVLALLPGAVRAAWQLAPSLELRETWSDNAGLRPDGQKESRFITSVTPGITATNNTPRFQFSASYRLNAFAYSDSRVSGTDRFNSSLNATARGELLSDFLFFDAQAGISQTPVSAFGPVSDSPYADTNRSEVRTWRIAPYLRHTFGGFASAELRYSHDLVDADQEGFGHSTADTVHLAVTSGQNFRTVGWALDLNREQIDDSIAPASINSRALASLRYILTSQLSLTATGGYDKFDYEEMGETTKGASWSAGFAWTPSSHTSLTASAGKRYYGNSYFLAATHRSRNTVWSINYSDDVTTSRSSFLLPSAVDTAAMLNQMFMPNYPDPVQRAIAVAAYIRALNLPPTLPNSINYFSNRYMLQRTFNASVALRTARTTTMATLYRTRREALSRLQYDSDLLGSGVQNLNDDTDQTGLALMLDYRLSARTSAAVSATLSRSESRSAGYRQNNRLFRAYLTRTFSQKLAGSVEVRRNYGELALQNSSYTENTVAASLSLRF
jgi:uncharacterized protein (PEP-CTERM system associated)